MEIVVFLLVVVAVAFVASKFLKKPDANNDGVVNAKDVVVAAKEVVVEAKTEVAAVADVNKDGKVDVADVKAASEVVVQKAKRGRKPKAKVG